MKILITGATGLIGSNLIPFLRPNEIAVYTRNVAMAEQILGHKIHFLSSLEHLKDLNDYQVVINFAGEPIVGKKWTTQQKHEIESSRWSITEKIVALIKASENPPELLISGSAVGYYGRQSDNIIDESFTNTFDDFGHQLCERWEYLAKKAESLQTRVCIVRTGVVLSKRGGALTKMLTPFKLGLGGVMGRGDQYFSWIHLEDMLKGLVHLITNKDCHGIYNFTAPHPVTNYQYSHELAKALRRPCLFKIPEKLLRAAMGESADLVLYGQRVVPKRLLESGYEFVFPDISQALDCLRK
ncbi:TIGR01777 family oxidoreductase [Paraglaciecola hydrolytica]|uniref:Epimerase n=1 Tax=Paraglaciecola hydrolytica TaxID=1799789 RepID=A0A136A3D8_9ALTE|nr:TIGR01777 family oxidoreductase [Paraglaciecola hydrolytica]KXI29758.1 epimerase [Paraglaciecola hydrolytica]